jgi:hypothetical protein
MVSPIQYLRRAAIDTTRWDHCIDESANGLIYGYSFYLDHMSRNWDALVWGDYEAVMPLTWNKKYGIYYLYQPAFTASLGVFGKNLTGEMMEQILHAIPKKFRLVEIELNHGNNFDCLAKPGPIVFNDRTNYVLPLDKPYETLYAGYRENLQRNLKKSVNLGVKYVTDIAIDEVIALARQQMEGITNYGSNDYENFKKLFELLHDKKQALTCGVYTHNNELTASAAFFFSHKRAYYILVGNRIDQRTDGASPYLLDRFIHDHAGKDLLLDFEGSDIHGLAYFYSSFGAVQELYPSARVNSLPLIVKILSSKF